MSNVTIRLGDMFDGPCDMVVLPCSTSGTITPFVRTKLMHFRIPFPSSRMELGDVHLMPFEGGENIAQFVAYAASVRRGSSSPEAIHRIAEQIGIFTRENRSIRLVAAPLLGSGAGHMDAEVVAAALRKGFMESAHSDATLTINVLHENIFRDIQPPFIQRSKLDENEQSLQFDERPPRVFISYTHSSQHHVKWVESIGTFLRTNGIDARLDSWHLRRGMDLPQFMTNELALADRVLIISDEKYAEKADGRVGGVGWETMIVQGDMAQLPPESTKYLVLVRSHKLDNGIPKFLKTKFVIHCPDESSESECKQLLLKELFDYVEIPPIGQRPVFRVR